MCVDSTACSDRLREQPRVPLEPVRELEAERCSARPHDERRAGAVLQGAQPGRQLLEGPPRYTVVLYCTALLLVLVLVLRLRHVSLTRSLH